MDSRKRVTTALQHKEPDRVPVDLGGSVTTGIHATALDKLRRCLGLENQIVKVFFHTCGSIVDIMADLVEVGVDIINPVQPTAAGMERIITPSVSRDSAVTNPFGK